jgi:hypothetical protein
MNAGTSSACARPRPQRVGLAPRRLLGSIRSSAGRPPAGALASTGRVRRFGPQPRLAPFRVALTRGRCPRNYARKLCAVQRGREHVVGQQRGHGVADLLEDLRARPLEREAVRERLKARGLPRLHAVSAVAAPLLVLAGRVVPVLLVARRPETRIALHGRRRASGDSRQRGRRPIDWTLVGDAPARDRRPSGSRTFAVKLPVLTTVEAGRSGAARPHQALRARRPRPRTATSFGSSP